MSATITDPVTPRCDWCGSAPARPFAVTSEHSTAHPELCDECSTECIQAVWAVRHQVMQRQREARTAAYAAKTERAP